MTCTTTLEGPPTLARFSSSLILSATLLAIAATPARAAVSLDIEYFGGRSSRLFDSHMILQRDTIVPVWGKADPGEVVTVDIALQSKTTTADFNGDWRVELEPVPAGGPYEMTIYASNTIELDDILFGDVYVMAGQSNLMIKRPRSGDLAEFPNARVFKRTWNDRPGGMPFNFAKTMSAEHGVPVGVLQRCMRGSSGLSRTWFGPDLVTDDPYIQEILDGGNCCESYETVIRQVAGYAVKAIIWWQGESDTRSKGSPGLAYSHHLPAIVQSWRDSWGQGDIPFLFMQEPVGAGYQAHQTEPDPRPSETETMRLGEMRHAFIQSLSEPRTQVITSADLVPGLHPRDREGYLQRIKTAVLGFVWGEPITFAGPTFAGSSIESGNRVRIRFREGTADGLHARGGPLQGFWITDDGVSWSWAQSQIEGNEVVVWSNRIANPIEVRYGFHERYGYANLFNGAGMACPTFSTNASPHPHP